MKCHWKEVSESTCSEIRKSSPSYHDARDIIEKLGIIIMKCSCFIFIQPFEDSFLWIKTKGSVLPSQWQGWIEHPTEPIIWLSFRTWWTEVSLHSDHSSFQSLLTRSTIYSEICTMTYLPVIYPLDVAVIPRASRGTRRRAMHSWIHSSHSLCDANIFN